MVKQRSAAEIHVPDGAGGVRAVKDLRFEDGDWPIDLVVSTRYAAQWMAHLHAELESRQWGWSSFGQPGKDEQSGSISVHTSTGANPNSIDVVWEKARDEQLHIRARPSSSPTLSIEVVQDFLAAVTTRQRVGKTEQAHRTIFLTYLGRPWVGELWLDGSTRLGPPSQPTAQWSAEQIVRVDLLVEGIGNAGITSAFQRRVHDLCVFLSLMIGACFKTVQHRQDWVADLDPNGQVIGSTLKWIGYAEPPEIRGFPSRGDLPSVPKIEILRPGIGGLGVGQAMQEQWVPADIEYLWTNCFSSLDERKRNQFLQAGNIYHNALLQRGQRTTYAALMVVACEALKPLSKRYDRLNVYDIVASLVGKEHARYLRSLQPHPQKIRSDHFHRGKLSTRELLPIFMLDYFGDPSFGLIVLDLATTSRICLIEWLRREGQYEVVRMSEEKTTIREAWRDFAWSGWDLLQAVFLKARGIISK